MDAAATDSAETRRLLTELRAGKPGAFQQLFSRHRAYLYEVIEMRLDDRMRQRVDVSDVLQETQLEAARRMPGFLERRPMPFRLWLRKTAHERLLKLREAHVKAEKRSVKREVPLPDRSSLDLAYKLLGSATTPSEQASRRELASRMRRAVARLPDLERDAVLMLDFEGLSSHEAACILGVDASTVHRRHGRALMRLHRILSGGGLTESQI